MSAQKKYIGENALLYLWQKIKGIIPTKTSELTNDSNFLTSVPSDYIKNTDYVSSSNSGIVTLSEKYNLGASSTGELRALGVSYETYLTNSERQFIGKATLENVLEAKGYLTEDTLPKYNGEVE